jgi:uncharacterized delta-60 repeat protein
MLPILDRAVRRGRRVRAGSVVPERLEARRLLSAASPVPRGGVITTSFGGGPDDIHALAVQKDGKIVAGGESGTGDGVALTLARYNPDGSLDPTFGSGGTAIAPLAKPSDKQLLRTMALQPDGKIIAGGDMLVPLSGGGFQGAMFLVRYNSDGTRDAAFDSNVSALVSVIGDVRSVALQPDGKIVVVGASHPVRAANAFTITRLNPDGTVDHSFGSNGFVGTSFNTSPSDGAQGIAVLGDGRIVVGGNATVSNLFKFGLLALNANGSPDTSFGTGGKVVTSLSDDSELLQSIAVGADGKIVAVGFAQNHGQELAEVARYDSHGVPDPTFAGTGAETLTTRSESDFSSAVVLPDVSIIAAGGATNPSYIGLTVTKLRPDGSPDPTFGAGGSIGELVGGAPSRADAVALLPDGRIAAAGNYQGTFGNPAGDHFALALFTPDGASDPTFGGPYDINHSGFVDFPDLIVLAQHYGKAGTFADGDLNGDGKIAFDDLLIFVRNYGNNSTLPSGQNAAPGLSRHSLAKAVTDAARHEKSVQP